MMEKRSLVLVALDELEDETGLALTPEVLASFVSFVRACRLAPKVQPLPTQSGAVTRADISADRLVPTTVARLIRDVIFTLDEQHDEALVIEAWKRDRAAQAAAEAYRQAGQEFWGV